MEKLGAYITQEYGLLKEILLYLPTADLLNASKVCRSWAKVVDVMLAEVNRPLWRYSSRENKYGHDVNQFCKITPLIILYHTNKTVTGCRGLECCPCKLVLDCTDLFLFKDIFQDREKSDYGSDGYDFISYSSSMLALPSMPGIEINKVIVDEYILNEEVNDETLNRLIGTEPIKCLLVYTQRGGGGMRARAWIKKFLLKVIKRNNGSIAIGGGDARTSNLFQGKHQCRKRKFPLLFVTFRGENVTAHSQLLKADTKEGIDIFMKKMAENLGSVPSGSERIALIYTCVNRCYKDDLDEGQLFKQAFPTIPHFGFISFGEYGINTISDHNFKKRKTQIQVVHSDTTSIVVLTFHNLPSKKVFPKKYST